MVLEPSPHRCSRVFVHAPALPVEIRFCTRRPEAFAAEVALQQQSNCALNLYFRIPHTMPDPRFERLRTDPRFRRPKKKQSKVVVDDRFKSLFVQEKKRGRVDKYGRAISEKHEEDNLKRFYRLEADDDLKPGPDYARGQILLESSDEEDVKNDNDVAGSEESDDSSQFDGIVTIGGVKDEDEEVEIDLDENDFADLDAQALEYSRTHPQEAEPDHQLGGQRTDRLAAVNLDWDHVRAVHLYRICSSLVSPTAPLASTSNTASESKKGAGVVRGQVLSVRVYPSQFGKERLAREEKEGPPVEIFQKRKRDEEVNEQNIYDVGDGADYDEDALRKYQLERLRYYYAVITCDTVDAASHIYSELDGTELERSANVFDLSFVPDDMIFDDECRDEATEQELTSNYKPLEFATDALRHSKVKLTWDDDDPVRNHVTRRKLTRKEIEDADFRAYLASSSSESDEGVEGADWGTKKQGKKTAERDRLRALLLAGGTDNLPEGWLKDGKDSDVDMEITFTPGISDKKDEEHETTLDKYQKKMREKRKQRKEEKEKDAGPEKAIEGDEFFGADSGDESESDAKEERRKSKGGKEKEKNSNRNTQAKTPVSAEELALLVAADDPNSEPKHFNLKSVIKAEKRKGKKGKKKQMRPEEENELQEDFVIDVHDERFQALHENPQFAIDPSNPRFKKTKSMSALLEERHRRQQTLRNEVKSSASKASHAAGKRGLHSLVESVKRKSANAERHMGKRRKL